MKVENGGYQPYSDSKRRTNKPVSPERFKAVDSAIKFWTQQLIDPGRRNTLLFYRDTKTTTLRLDSMPAVARERLILGHTVSLDELCAEGGDEEERETRLGHGHRQACAS